MSIAACFLRSASINLDDVKACLKMLLIRDRVKDGGGVFDSCLSVILFLLYLVLVLFYSLSIAEKV